MVKVGQLKEGRVYRLKLGEAITGFGTPVSKVSPIVLFDGKLICNWTEIFISYDAAFEEDESLAPLYNDLAGIK